MKEKERKSPKALKVLKSPTFLFKDWQADGTTAAPGKIAQMNLKS